jgi:hypothetical protein
LFSPPRFLKLPVLGEGAISKKIVVFPCFDWKKLTKKTNLSLQIKKIDPFIGVSNVNYVRNYRIVSIVMTLWNPTIIEYWKFWCTARNVSLKTMEIRLQWNRIFEVCLGVYQKSNICAIT